MSQELLQLNPHEHRVEGSVRHVVIQRSISVSKPENGVALQRLRFEISSLNVQLKEGESQKVIPVAGRTIIDSIIDAKENSVEFLLNDADAALPEDLQGAGIGSYIMSEMIRWAQGVSPELQVKSIRLSSSEIDSSGREERLGAFFRQLGFQFVRQPGKGLYAVADTVGKLKAHVNAQKIERLNLLTWSNEWLERTVGLANQLRDESRNNLLYQEQIALLKRQKSSSLPFFAGGLAGLVLGLIVGLLIAL